MRKEGPMILNVAKHLFSMQHEPSLNDIRSEMNEVRDDRKQFYRRMEDTTSKC